MEIPFISLIAYSPYNQAEYKCFWIVNLLMNVIKRSLTFFLEDVKDASSNCALCFCELCFIRPNLVLIYF